MTSKSKLPHLDASSDVTERRGVLVLAGLNAAAAERSVVAIKSFIFTDLIVLQLRLTAAWTVAKQQIKLDEERTSQERL